MHRITRRGIPFDDHDEAHKRIADSDINNITDDMLEDNQPEEGVSLLFMCCQSNIASQFEVSQAFWANQGLIGGSPVKGRDSIVMQGTDLSRALPKQWGQPVRSDNFQFSGFVKMKGGEYFYTPSLPFLKHL